MYTVACYTRYFVTSAFYIEIIFTNKGNPGFKSMNLD